jgi:flagellin-like protein
MRANMNRKGISNVVATIILIAVAIALAVAVAVWVFGLAGSSAKTATLQIQAMSLNGTGSSGTLTLMVYNPSSSAISINAFTLSGLTCTLASGSNPVVIPGGANGELTIQISGTTASASFNGGTSSSFTCTGSLTITPGVQYSGTIVTTSGQQYPFTVTASS